MAENIEYIFKLIQPHVKYYSILVIATALDWIKKKVIESPINCSSKKTKF